MKLTIQDIVFIAEMRAIGIQWKWLGRIYGVNYLTLQSKFRYWMAAGFYAKDKK